MRILVVRLRRCICHVDPMGQGWEGQKGGGACSERHESIALRTMGSVSRFFS